MKRCREDGGLEDKIISQVEYYFGEENYPKDKYLQGLAAQSKLKNGYVMISDLMKFARMKKLSQKEEVVVRSLRKSAILELDTTGKFVRKRSSSVNLIDEMKRISINQFLQLFHEHHFRPQFTRSINNGEHENKERKQYSTQSKPLDIEKVILEEKTQKFPEEEKMQKIPEKKWTHELPDGVHELYEYKRDKYGEDEVYEIMILESVLDVNFEKSIKETDKMHYPVAAIK